MRRFPKSPASTMPEMGAESRSVAPQVEEVETAGGENASTLFVAYRSDGVQEIWDHPDREEFLDKCIGRLDRFDIPRGGPKHGRMNGIDRINALVDDAADRFGWFKLPKDLAEASGAYWLFVCAHFEAEEVWLILSSERDRYLGPLPDALSGRGRSEKTQATDRLT